MKPKPQKSCQPVLLTYYLYVIHNTISTIYTSKYYTSHRNI